MTASSGYGPKELDVDVPSAARAYDYFLGGSHNFQSDRAFADQVRDLVPWVPNVARLNRSFLRRVVRYCLDQGIDQFLDLGSGIPTVGNVHEIAQQRFPEARVVYVDYEPIAYQHAHALLADDPNTTIIQADIRDPEAVLEHPQTRQLLDFTRPVGLLMVGILLEPALETISPASAGAAGVPSGPARTYPGGAGMEPGARDTLEDVDGPRSDGVGAGTGVLRRGGEAPRAQTRRAGGAAHGRRPHRCRS